LPWPGSPEEVWMQFYDVAVPMRPYIDSFSSEERAAAFKEALAMLPPNRKPDFTELTVAMNFCFRSSVAARAELQCAASACERRYACPLAPLTSHAERLLLRQRESALL